MVSNETMNYSNRPTSMNPKKFGFWLGLVSIVMVFGGLTSAYIVRKADPGWRFFDLPLELRYSTAIIVISSVTMHWAFLSAKKDQQQNVKLGIVMTFLLGMVFLYLQLMSFSALIDRGIFFTGEGSNVSASFLYVITWLHGLHIVSAILFLVYAFVNVKKIESKNILMIESCTTYWHFLGLLWLYLYFFIL